MALFEALDNPNTFTSISRSNKIQSDFDMLNALPSPILVRGKNLDIIFQNKTAQRSKLFFDDSCYHSEIIQDVIRKKSTLLFQENSKKVVHDFELEISERYFNIHQSLVKTKNGAQVIIETLKDITVEKTNKLAVHLMSLEVKDKKEASTEYFNKLTSRIAQIFDLDMVTISMTTPAKKENTTLSCYLRKKQIPNFVYNLEESACARVFETKKALFIPTQLNTLFPSFSFTKKNNFNSFYGVPLINTEHEVIGLLCITNQNPIEKISLIKTVFAELVPKLTMEVSAKKHFQKLSLQSKWINQAINSYQDPLCIFSKDLEIISFNESYEKACMKQFGVNVVKGLKIFDEINKNNTLTNEELSKRELAIQKTLNGERSSVYISLGEGSSQTSYVLTFNPIFNHDKTEVKEILLLSHNTTDLMKTQKELEKVKNYHSSVFENTKTGIGVYDSLNNKWLDYNQQFIKLFGRDLEKNGKQYKIEELSPEIQPNGIPSKELMQQLFKGAKKSERFHSKWTNLRLDGTEFHSENTFIPINDDDQPGLYCVAINDLTEQLSHQVILEQKNHELEQYIKSNMQLEHLAYSACHDLKEPLRTIGNFTQIIKKKYEDTIDEQSKEHMGFIINGVKRMNYFVDGLFEYSRIRENKNKFEDFSLGQLLEYIELDLNIKGRDVSIDCKNIPESITANRTKLKQLFQNMIANAIKFQRPNIKPEIKIKGSENSTHWNFSVSDNGIGIHEDYHDQIFTLFRKLHSKDQYEGSGIGLALCKEIIEQHQGEITLDSELDQGTTFHFSIAKHLEIA